MSAITLEVLFLLVLILTNGIFAMSEAAVISARKARLQQRANSGDEGARRALDLANEPSDFLAAIQVGITLVGVLAGAFGGATIAEQLTHALRKVSFLAPYAPALSLALVVIAITYLSLIFGELVPKSLALNTPETIAARVARPMIRLAKTMSPLVFVLSASTDAVLRIFGLKESGEAPVTEEEITLMIDQATHTGAFQKSERDMVARVFRLADLRAEALMIPRTEIVWFDTTDSPEIIRDKLIACGHSRFPVARGDLDHMVGIVQATDLLGRLLCGEPLDLGSSVRTPLFVPDSMPALAVLDTLKRTGNHMALVMDEYGGVQGLLTLTNLLEEMAGDVAISHETIEPQIVRREDGSWLLDGMLPVEHLKDVLDVKPEAFDDTVYQTLGGFVLSRMGRIPTSGEHFDAFGYRFEVVDMDGHRVDKVLVASLPDHPPPPGTD